MELRTQHLDPHLDAVTAALQTRLSGYIDLVNAATGAAPDVPHVPAANVFPGGQWPIPTLTDDAPAIEVAIPSFGLSGLSVDATDADENLTVVMRCWVKYTGPAETAVGDIYRLNSRLVRAVLALVVPQANAAWGNNAIVTAVQGRYRADPETDQREAWTSSCVLSFTVEDVDLF